MYAHNKANHFEDQGALIYVFRKDGISLLCGNDTGFFYEEVWNGLRLVVPSERREKESPCLNWNA
ncbi:MAG: hypothetical protein GX354_08915 [Firmicutes bacterium]|nr:hypothetical protein [Bacillota bacterium]